MTTTPAPDSEEMRLDELARQAGVASTTVRLYQAKGLLPPPRLVGRTGWYGPHHLTRLALVARLQEQGFSLAGIARLLDSWQQGRDLAELVGVEEQIDALLPPADDLVLSPAELAARFPADSLTPDLVARATALGLVEPTGDGRLRVPDRRFLDTGAALVALGVPADAVLDEWEQLTVHTDAIAERFVAVFRRHLAPPGTPDGPDGLHGLDAATTAHLAATLAQLRRHAHQVVATAFATSLAQATTTALAPLTDG